jgi:hypothetical protein
MFQNNNDIIDFTQSISNDNSNERHSLNRNQFNSSELSIITSNDGEDENIIIDDKSILIENIEEEEKLINYTENHFLNKLNNFHMDIHGEFTNHFTQNNYTIFNHSPVMSVYGSRSNSNSNSNNNSDNEEDTNFKYKKLSYEDIEKSINKYYNLEIDNKYSSEIDILTTYMKGQKHLYIQSKYLAQYRLNCLMFPSLTLAAFITIVTPFIECQVWSTGFVSGCNAIIALLISLINYLKLESSIELYLQMANHYDNLETMLELTNSKIMVLNREEDISMLVLTKLKEVEKKIAEIKLPNNILIPEEIKMQFPIICHINIFSFIKKTEIYKKSLIEKLRDITNEIRFILYKWEKNNISMDISGGDNTNDNINDLNDIVKIKEKNRLLYLYDIKNKIKDEIIEFRTTYGFMDDLFTKEIKIAEERKRKWWFYFMFCFLKKNHMNDYLKDSNPIILKYYKSFFEKEHVV